MSIDEPIVAADLADQERSALPGDQGEGMTAAPEADGGSGDSVDAAFGPDESFVSGESAAAEEPAGPDGSSVVVTDAFLETDEIVVTQVPLHTDRTLVTTVEDVRSSPAYREWQGEQDTTIGDASDADFWFQQATDYTCAPAVATQIIEDFTGKEAPNEFEVAEYATERGMLDEDGMYPHDLATVLTDLGVPSEVKHHQTWKDVARYLEEGRSVVMTVDSGDYWPGYRDNSDGIDHVVRVVAIDTERGVAILSDPGHPDGQHLEVPLETLDEAWRSPNGMLGEDRMLIVSEQPDPTPDDGSSLNPFAGAADAFETGIGSPEADPFAAPEAGPGAGPGAGAGAGAAAGDEAGVAGRVFANPAGWVLIPVTLAAARIFATRNRT